MLFVVCRDGVPVRSFREPMTTWDDVSLKLKQLYIKEQTQEIYMLTENRNPQWSKAEFKFKPYGGGMHPKSAEPRALAVDALPKQIQIQHLMGVL